MPDTDLDHTDDPDEMIQDEEEFDESLPSNPQEEEASRQLNVLREKLLDLSKRNRLLNYRHSPRSRDHIRIIDEVLPTIFKELRSQKFFRFEPLPDPNSDLLDPSDEMTDEFQAHLRNERHGESYQRELEKIYQETDEEEGEERFEAALNNLDRQIRDGIRERLSMPPLKKPPNQTNPSWARQHGINPSFSLLSAEEANRPEHFDRKIQTLLLPEQMEAKLKAIHQLANQSINEKGINTLFAAFGFLEWFESSDSDTILHAPLILLPVCLDKDISRGTITYKLESTGDDPILNETLVVRLRNENIKIPVYDPEADIEDFFSAIVEAIESRSRWMIRRYVTIGHFSFHRVAMYEDLDPQKWPLDRKPFQHQTVKELLGGRDQSSIGEFREVYNPDDPDFHRTGPLLVRDADSSQFSAVVDVLRGENLVIQGPPGTGKSQTISNIIAAAMAKGKTVLFVAEKLSALEVVKSRLDFDGVGDFCFELHSAKANKSAVLERVKSRLTQKTPRSSGVPDREKELIEAKQSLALYLSILETHIGSSEITVETALWLARRKRYSDLPDAFRDFRLKDCENWTPQQREDLKSFLCDLADAEEELSEKPSQSLWRFIKNPNLTVTECAEIRECLSSLLVIVKRISDEQDQFNRTIHWEFPRELGKLSGLVHEIQQLPTLTDGQSIHAFNLLADSNILNEFKSYLNLRQQLHDQTFALRCEGINFETSTFVDLQASLADALHEIEKENLTFSSLSGLKHEADRQARRFREIEGINENLIEYFKTIGTPQIDPDIEDLEFLLSAFHIADAISPEIIAERHSVLLEKDALNEIESISLELRNRKNAVEKMRRDVGISGGDPSLRHLRMHRRALESGGLLGFLKPGFRAAKKFVLKLYLEERNRPLSEIIDDLKGIEEVTEHLDEFLHCERILRITRGDSRDLEDYLQIARSIAAWYNNVERLLSSQSGLREPLLRFIREASLEEMMQWKNRSISDQDLIQLLDDLNSSSNVTHATSLIEIYSRRSVILNRLWETLAQKVGVPETSTLSELCNIRARLERCIQLSEQVKNLRLCLSKHFPDHSSEDALENIKAVYLLRESISSAAIDDSLKTTLLAPGGAHRLTACKNRIRELSELNSLLLSAKSRIQRLAQSNELPDWINDTPEQIRNQICILQEKDGDLEPWGEWMRCFNILCDSNGKQFQALVDQCHCAEEIHDHFDYFVGVWLSEVAYSRHSELKEFSGVRLEQAKRRVREIDDQLKLIAKDKIRNTLYNLGKQAPPGNGVGGKLTWSELSLLRNLAGLSKMHPKMNTARVIKQAGAALQCLMPCFMMSPLSVAHYIRRGGIRFDLVIFDEASQILPEDAVGAMLRGHQFVVVGDRMQLPPTSFFSTIGSTVDAADEAEDVIVEESILEKAEAIFQPPRRLLWHYRSKDPSLIAFSNNEFYDRELQIFPNPYPNHPTMGVKYCWVDGRYVGRSNPIEADKVVDAAINFMRTEPTKSLGIVALNAVQRDLIDRKLDLALARDPEANKYRKHWKSSIESLFVKNLESVQGDERDVIFISTVFGRSPGSDAPPAQRFGPINSEVGHRRLNVLFTRAKEAVYLFTSLRPEDIVLGEGASWGRRVLQNYLEYARSGRLHVGNRTGREPDSEFEIQVRDRLRAHGYDADCQVGVAGYFIDLAVKHPQAECHYLLGVECDGAKYHSFKSARDRDRLRQNILESLGWKIHRIWSTDWFSDPDRQMKQLINRIRELQATTKPIIIDQDQDSDSRINSIEQQRSSPAIDRDCFSADLPNVCERDATYKKDENEAAGKSGNNFPEGVIPPPLVKVQVPRDTEASDLLKSSKNNSSDENFPNAGKAEKLIFVYPNPQTASIDQVNHYLRGVVEEFGPIVAEHAYHIYLQRAQIQRLGGRIRSLFNRSMASMIRSGALVTVEDCTRIGQLDMVVRHPSQSDLVVREDFDRPLERIPENEIRESLRRIKKIHSRYDREDIMRAFLEKHGLKRLTAKAQSILDRALKTIEQ